MAETIYRLEIIREFKTKEEAIQAAERQERMGGRAITVYQDQRTASGQAFGRQMIWQDDNQMLARFKQSLKGSQA